MENRNEYAAPENSQPCCGQFARKDQGRDVENEGINAKIKNPNRKNNQWRRKKHENGFHDRVQNSQNQAKYEESEESFVESKVIQQEVRACQRSHRDEKTEEELDHPLTRD